MNIKKLNEHIKHIFNIICSIYKEHSKIFINVSAALFAVVLCTLLFDIDYAVSDGEKIITYVKSKSDLNNIIDSINNAYMPYTNYDDIITKKPQLSMQLVLFNTKCDTKALKEYLLKDADGLIKAYTINIDGVPMYAFTKKKDAKNTYESFINQYTDGSCDYSVKEKVEILYEYAPRGMLSTVNSALDSLNQNGAVSVCTSKVVTIEEDVPFETEQKDDENSYKGHSYIYQKGENGHKITTQTVNYVNGKKVSYKVTGEEYTKQPEKQIVMNGTMEISKNGTGRFLRPISGVITSRYGTRNMRAHKGVDIAGNHGDDIFAADTGVVTYSGWCEGYGNLIIIDHQNGYVTYYGHCSKLYANVGDSVLKGDVIATVGSTGRSTGPHLHFEVRLNGEDYDPLKFIDE